MRQRSALAQVGSPAAREKRSVFPRAVAEVTCFHYSRQALTQIVVTSHFISTVMQAYKATRLTNSKLARIGGSSFAGSIVYGKLKLILIRRE